MAKSAPAFAIPIAAAWPMPRLAPVMSTTLSFNDKSMGSYLLNDYLLKFYM
jgi:hypothetical protein